MDQVVLDLENNHTGRKLPTMAIRLGFLIEDFFWLSTGAVTREVVSSTPAGPTLRPKVFK